LRNKNIKAKYIRIGREPGFGGVYRSRYALGVSSTVNSAKAKRMEDGLIELYDGQYVVADPFFAQFLRTT